MFCISFQAAAAQYLPGLTGAVAGRQLASHTHLGQRPATAEQSQQPQARHADDVNGPAGEASAPLFFEGVQPNIHQHAASPPPSAPSTRRRLQALLTNAVPATNALAPGTHVNNQLLPLVVHAALQPAQQPPPPPGLPRPCPPGSLSTVNPALATLAHAQPRLKHLQLKGRAPSALIAADRMRALQLRLHALGMQLEACPQPPKELQLWPQAAVAPPGAYQPPQRSLQLRLRVDPTLPEASPQLPKSLQLRMHAEAIPPDAPRQSSKSLQLWQHGDPMPLEAYRPTPRSLLRVARCDSAPVALPKPVARVLAGVPTRHQAIVQAPAATGGPHGFTDTELAAPLLHPATWPRSVLPQAPMAAAAAAAIPSRGALHDGAGPHEHPHQGPGSGDSGWEWTGSGARRGPDGEEGSDGQAPGGTVQFMLLLAAALAGVMGLHMWPQHATPLQDAPLPAPGAAPASPVQRAGGDLHEDEEGTHPLLKTMQEALEHLEARQAALELEVACLKGIPRPSQDSIERKKEVEEELRSLAILQSALQQELRRLQ